MLKAIIFDFDGVIAESVNVKTQAFRILFKDYPQHLKDIIHFHVKNGGMSRFDKFRHIYKNIIKRPLSEDKFNKLCQQFSNLVVEKVVIAPFVEGAQQLLDKCLGRYKLFVISATPEKEIKNIIKRRNLGRYFVDIFGSPAKKCDLIRNILRNNNYSLEEVVFVGDSVNDFQAAKDAGIFFIARALDETTHWLKNSEVKARFENFTNTEEFLEMLQTI